METPPAGSPIAGTSSGAHILPGSDDDGWIIPPPVQLSDGTTIQLYKDGEAWRAAFDFLKEACSRICLEVYIFASDDLGRAVAELLCDKARKGVNVYVIYDSFGSVGSDRRMFEKMRRAGVRIQEFHPLRPWDCKFGWRPINRDHRKLLVMDNHIGWMGGLNLAREYGGSSFLSLPKRGRLSKRVDQWRDDAIGMRGPGVLQLTRAFSHSWNYLQHGGKIRRAGLIHDIHRGELGLLASVPTVNSPLRPFISELVTAAKKSIQLTMAYFAPDDDLIEELCKAAKNGVRVQLMLPGDGDILLLALAARSFYSTLLSYGIEIYERKGVMLHAKTMVVDGYTCVIGSTNLDYRSIEFNCELSTIIRSAEFGQQLARLFEHDIRYSRRIGAEAWRQRPYLDRIGQWAVSRARYWL
jgi:cardiolipin synthase A/B